MTAKKDYLILAGLLLVIFSVYLTVMPPSYKNNDSPETTAAAYTLGIGHPPGYPLFSMAGKAASLIPAGNPAFRMNIFSAFLAFICLIMAYFTAGKLGISGGIYGFLTVLILAFSYIFLNQGTEAKGGIYMLNLFFLTVLIYLSLSLFRGYTNSCLYLISYVFGLGLTNHWPSMIILAPVFIWLFVKYRSRITVKTVLTSCAFFVIGITAYLYLPIRAASGAALNWGDPENLKNFLWVVLRKAYIYPVKASMHVYMYQLKEFLIFFITDYSMLVLFSFAGAAVLFKKGREIFYLLVSVFIIVFVMVVLYNRTKESVIWLIHIFLMPAMYAALLLALCGISDTIKRFRKKWIVYVLAVFIIGAFIHMAVYSLSKSYNRYNFIAYDWGGAIDSTLDKGSVYLADGDYNLMPLYYMQEVEKKRKDIVFVTDSFMIFKWGIDDFVKKYGNIPMQEFKTEENIKNIIEHYAGKRPVLRSSHYPRVSGIDTGLLQAQKGILFEFSKKPLYYGRGIFDLYSYRNVFDKLLLNDRPNRDVIGWYPVSMVNQANTLTNGGFYSEAIELYKRSLLFPVEKPEAQILNNIALVYEIKKDRINELKYLVMAADKGIGQAAVYEKAGLLAYETGMLDLAYRMFKDAEVKGSRDQRIRKGIEILNKTGREQRLEFALNKANDYLNKGDFRTAEYIYDFLLEKGYKKAIIYRNIGVYHFRTKDYDKAVEYFKASNNETPDAETFLYLAHAYYSKGDVKMSVETAQTGIKRFPENAALKDYNSKIEGKGKDVKNTSGVDR